MSYVGVGLVPVKNGGGGGTTRRPPSKKPPQKTKQQAQIAELKAFKVNKLVDIVTAARMADGIYNGQQAFIVLKNKVPNKVEHIISARSKFETFYKHFKKGGVDFLTAVKKTVAHLNKSEKHNKERKAPADIYKKAKNIANQSSGVSTTKLLVDLVIETKKSSRGRISMATLIVAYDNSVAKRKASKDAGTMLSKVFPKYVKKSTLDIKDIAYFVGLARMVTGEGAYIAGLSGSVAPNASGLASIYRKGSAVGKRLIYSAGSEMREGYGSDAAALAAMSIDPAAAIDYASFIQFVATKSRLAKRASKAGGIANVIASRDGIPRVSAAWSEYKKYVKQAYADRQKQVTEAGKRRDEQVKNEGKLPDDIKKHTGGRTRREVSTTVRGEVYTASAETGGELLDKRGLPIPNSTTWNEAGLPPVDVNSPKLADQLDAIGKQYGPGANPQGRTRIPPVLLYGGIGAVALVLGLALTNKKGK